MGDSGKILLIHASNVMSMGAAKVVGSLLHGFQNVVDERFARVDVLLPGHGALGDFTFSDGRFVKHVVARRLPNSLSRIVECLVPQKLAVSADCIVTLGDIPLKTRRPQSVFVNQFHLVKPSVAAGVSRSPRFAVMRGIFERNCRFATRLVVQTPVMADCLRRSYPAFEGRVEQVWHPVPEGFDFADIAERRTHHGFSGKLRLFYPAASYEHKNFALVRALSRQPGWADVVDKLVLTVDGRERGALRGPTLELCGRVSYRECADYYAWTDALFFPSRAESCGLPLIEAMRVGMPVVAADLPYAHSLCGDGALYFDPESPHSAIQALQRLKWMLSEGWKPDWSQQVARLAPSWDAVCRVFLAGF